MQASQTLQLFPDQPQRLDAAHGIELYVESGIVWITTDAVGDLFFSAGERYRIPTGGIVLAEALRGEATVRLESVETLSSDDASLSVKSALVSLVAAAALAWPRARRRPYRPFSGGTAC